LPERVQCFSLGSHFTSNWTTWSW